MKLVIIKNTLGRDFTTHGPMTNAEAAAHAKKLEKIIDHEHCWIEVTKAKGEG